MRRRREGTKPNEDTMIKRDHGAAAEALIQWFESQDIDPFDSVPIMAAAMVVACISLAKTKYPDDRKAALQDTTDRVKAASALVLETLLDMLEQTNKQD
jgi:hypothetical protein